LASTAAPLFLPIEQDLAQVERRIEEAASPNHALLRGILQQVMLTPGKRIRPALTVASGRLFRDATAPLHAMAAAVEFLHTATLIHDDVVDQTDTRRGSPAFYHMVGNSVAVLVGDYLFAQAAATASETNNLRIMRLFAESVMTLCQGQIEEASREGKARAEVDRDNYYRTIEAKTAALFVLSCHAGAILGEANARETTALCRFARSLGLAFQIVDDILDLTGDESVMGKPAGTDLRQGLVTLPLIYLRDELPEALYQKAFSTDGERDEAIAFISQHARGSRAVRRALDEARQLTAQAARALDDLPRGECRDLLAQIAVSTVSRDA
jgi:geranylgeranyl pyrophosphate synthase